MNLEECCLALAKLEEDGSVLYKKFSEKCSENLKPVVLAFSSEEEKHKKLLLELSKDRVFKGKQINDNINDIFNQQIDYINNKSKNIKLDEEKEFFLFALQLEKNSIVMYTKLLKIFEINSYEYKSFEKLIKEEKSHMVYILNKLYEVK